MSYREIDVLASLLYHTSSGCPVTVLTSAMGSVRDWLARCQNNVLGETASVTCRFYPSVGARDLVSADPAPRCTTHALRCTTHALRCTTHALRCTTHALRCTIHALRCTTHALRCTTHALRCTTHALRCTTHALRCTTHAVGTLNNQSTNKKHTPPPPLSPTPPHPPPHHYHPLCPKTPTGPICGN